jgi:pimeloyl-ACP methyl ester carboxylesterase
MAALFPYIFVVFNVHRLKLHSRANPQSQCHLAYRDVTFTTRDGLQLAAWLIPCPGSRRAVVVCHGLGANKNVFVDVAPILHRAGYNVLMFDFRGHGDSAGYTTSFGPHEALDVEAAVAYLQDHGFDQIIGYGFSMGGAALLYAVPHLPVLRGVVLDSTYADFAPLMAAAARADSIHVGGRFGLRLVDCYGRFEAGVWPSRIAPRKFIAQIAPRPLFIIHGLADGLIPAAQAQLNYQAAREPEALWLVPSAGHCGCLRANIAVYEKRIAQFLRRCQS